MALPADGSPMLEGLPDNGKEHGKLWLNEADTVSEDHGEELSYSSPSQSVDCSTSSSGSSTTSSSGSNTISSSGSSTTSSSGSNTISSSGSSTTSSCEDKVGNDSTTRSNKDEVDNEDQDDFKSRLRVVQVLRPNIKFLWGIGVLEQSLKHLNWTVDKVGSCADAVSQLLKILPPHFKDIKVIGVSQKPQEDTVSCTKLEFTSGLDKLEEPILRSKKSRPIDTLQHRQVDLEEDAASLTSGRARRTMKMDAVKEDGPPSNLSFGTVCPSSFIFKSGLDKQKQPILRPKKSRPIGTLQHQQVGFKEDAASLTSGQAWRTMKKVDAAKVDAAKEDGPPSKLSFGTVLPYSFKFTCGLDKKQEPDMRPEDSSPISISPQPLAGWKTLVASLAVDRPRRTTKKVNAAKEDDPSSKPSHQVGLKEDAAHVTSVTGKNGKRKKDSDAEEQHPAKRTRDTAAEEVLPAKRTKNSVDSKKESSAKRIRENQADDELPSKRTRDTVAKEEPPAKRTKISLPPRGDLFAKFRPGAEDPAKRTRDSVTEEEVAAKRTNHSDEVTQSILDQLAWRCDKEWGDKANPSTSLFIPCRRRGYKDRTLLPPVVRHSLRPSSEDPVPSTPFFIPLSTLVRRFSVFSSPDLSPSCEMPHEMPAKQEPSDKRTKDSDAEEEPPAQWTKIALPPRGDLFAKFRPGAEDPTKRTWDGVTEEEVAAKRTNHSDEVIQSILERLTWRCEKEWGDKAHPSSSLLHPRCRREFEEPIQFFPYLSLSPRMSCEDPFLSSPDSSPSSLTHCEDPILSPCVFSPPPQMPSENPILSHTEEEQIPSTSGGIIARGSS